jgi:tight adherence protein B
MGIDATGLFAALFIGVGVATAVLGVLLRAQRRSETLAELLALVGGELDVPVEAVTESPEAPSVSQVTARLGDLLGRLDKRGSLERALAKAEIPLQPGEYLFLAGLATVVSGGLIGLAVNSALAGIAVAGLVGYVCRMYVHRRADKRREALQVQLPDAFSLIASSVASGHTFLRSIQLLREQIAQHLANELDRVVAEVSLGSNLVDALERFALRSEIVDLRWAVQAVRIQQTSGGQLAELLHTLAGFMRAREEVHREVRVLSAEGRFSGWVLMALPFFVMGCLLIKDPSYLHPFFQGWGFAWLGLCGAMLLSGFVVIRRLVRIEV